MRQDALPEAAALPQPFLYSQNAALIRPTPPPPAPPVLAILVVSPPQPRRAPQISHQREGLFQPAQCMRGSINNGNEQISRRIPMQGQSIHPVEYDERLGYFQQ